MKAVTKICPSCNNEFQAERKNKTYCSDTCRAEVNNGKLRDKMKSLKELESKSSLGDKYKVAYLSAMRIVILKYDHKKDGDFVNFEGQRFQYHSMDETVLEKLGVRLNSNASKEGSSERIAIYIPSEKTLFFRPDPRGTYTHAFKKV